MTNAKLLHDFVTTWTGRGYEKGDTHSFWLALLQALGIDVPTNYIEFEHPVKVDHTDFIDGYIAATKVLIEQKSLEKNLGDPIRQSDGSLLTPYEQAKRYANELPHSLQPRWIVTCNFREFWVYDTELPHSEPQKIALSDLEKEHYRLRFLLAETNDTLRKEMELSIKAGDLVGRIYDAILPQYAHPDSPETLQSLNQLCVRLVFLLFAEDAGLFGDKNEFHDYLMRYPARDIRRALIDLFRVLDTKMEDRDPYLDDDLKVFPYVNGGLFSNENIEIPQFTDDIRTLILTKASEDFDWSEISPTIFGAVFESTLNPDTRRSGGMHYTSIENIHKVIDPLFLNGLRHELEACRTNRDYARFQDKLASLTFFDPACGSGNFLTETYVSLRRLENEAIQHMQGGQMVLGDLANPIKVDIHQFYGIEINDFAVSVATTALWIAELQMMHETEKIASFHVNPLPLKSYHNIHEGNALRLDWNEIVPPDRLSYIMGNPPFVGFTFMDAGQKEDMNNIFPGIKNLDYVCAWYKKASDLIQDRDIRCAFVSTNSITQGETVPRFWPNLNVHIDFAYPTFRWDSESSLKAHVHCVIIGFRCKDIHSQEPARLYNSDGTYRQCKNINAYLMDADDIIVESRNKPLCDVPDMIYGNKPADGGNLIIEAADYDDFIQKEPTAQKWIRPLIGAVEYLHNQKRYCLWLVGITPAEIKQMPLVYDRVRRCKEMREASVAAAIRKFAETPHLFAQRTQPEEGNFIIVPLTTGETRKYVPMGFLPAVVRTTNACSIIPEATLYHFGVLTSSVHMAWMRAVCGRLKSDYRYSKDIVYNNFPWPTILGETPVPGIPELTEENWRRIEQTAQAILDARALYPDCSLADLYDDNTMPPELRRAHQDNDRAVLSAYGFDKPIISPNTKLPFGDSPQTVVSASAMSESDLVAALLGMYQQLTK